MFFMTYHKTLFAGILAAMVFMSSVSLIAFCADKKRAAESQMRIKEKTLLAVTVCFGAFGALIGRYAAHHKTDKIHFGIVIKFSLLLQIAVLAYSAYIAFICKGGT